MKRLWSSRDAFRARALRCSREEWGAILPLTLMILLVLSVMVAALLALGVTEPQIAANVLRGSQALSLAEAGAEHAIAQFVANPTPVNTACDPSCGASVTLFSSQSLQNIGTYSVTYRPIAFATVLVESTGNTTLGTIGTAQRTVRVVLTTQFVSKFALLGNQVEADGNAKVKGARGAVHGNKETEVEGSAFVEQTATSAGEECDGCTTPCNPCDPSNPASKGVGIPGLSGGGKAVETIPSLSPLDFLSKATIILGDGGTYSCGGIPIVVPKKTILNVVAIGAVAVCTLTPENSGIFSGWKMGGAGEWSFSGGTTPPDGTYYASKEIEIKASPGTPSSPWKATFISGSTKEEGEVEIEGHPNIVPYYQDLLIIAGEVELKGTGGDASLTGVIWATASDDGDDKGEVELSGSVNLTGNIITTGEIEIKGNATVTYNVGTRTRILGPLRVLSWSTVSQ